MVTPMSGPPKTVPVVVKLGEIALDAGAAVAGVPGQLMLLGPLVVAGELVAGEVEGGEADDVVLPPAPVPASTGRRSGAARSCSDERGSARQLGCRVAGARRRPTPPAVMATWQSASRVSHPKPPGRFGARRARRRTYRRRSYRRGRRSIDAGPVNGGPVWSDAGSGRASWYSQCENVSGRVVAPPGDP